MVMLPVILNGDESVRLYAYPLQSDADAGNLDALYHCAAVITAGTRRITLYSLIVGSNHADGRLTVR